MECTDERDFERGYIPAYREVEKESCAVNDSSNKNIHNSLLDDNRGQDTSELKRPDESDVDHKPDYSEDQPSRSHVEILNSINSIHSYKQGQTAAKALEIPNANDLKEMLADLESKWAKIEEQKSSKTKQTKPNTNTSSDIPSDSLTEKLRQRVKARKAAELRAKAKCEASWRRHEQPRGNYDSTFENSNAQLNIVIGKNTGIKPNSNNLKESKTQEKTPVKVKASVIKFNDENPRDFTLRQRDNNSYFDSLTNSRLVHCKMENPLAKKLGSIYKEVTCLDREANESLNRSSLPDLSLKSLHREFDALFRRFSPGFKTVHARPTGLRSTQRRSIIKDSIEEDTKHIRSNSVKPRQDYIKDSTRLENLGAFACRGGTPIMASNTLDDLKTKASDYLVKSYIGEYMQNI